MGPLLMDLIFIGKKRIKDLIITLGKELEL